MHIHDPDEASGGGAESFDDDGILLEVDTQLTTVERSLALASSSMDDGQFMLMIRRMGKLREPEREALMGPRNGPQAIAGRGIYRWTTSVLWAMV